MSDTSYLIQLLLPVRDNAGRTFPDAIWKDLKTRLADRFGGVTAFTRAPADGVWAPSSARRAAEEVFMVEVMAPALDHAWWAALQAELERTLAQDYIVIRALPITQIGRKN